MFIFVTIYAMSFIGFLIHYYKVTPISYPKLIELFLLYQLVFNIGFFRSLIIYRTYFYAGKSGS